jgi:hypothetical protein
LFAQSGFCQKETQSSHLADNPVPPNPKLIPDISLIAAQSTDTDEVLRERVHLALPRIIADLGRQAGEAAWKDMPASVEMSLSDRTRLIRETAGAYQRNLTQRQINDIAEDVFRRLRAQGDAGLGRGGK